MKNEHSIILSVSDRIGLPSLRLPQGSIVENDLADVIMERIKIADKEKEDIGFVLFPDGRCAWNPAYTADREYVFLSHEIRLLQQGIKFLDEKKAIPAPCNSLAKKILKINIDKKDEDN